jgi:hypothetical protein
VLEDAAADEAWAEDTSEGGGVGGPAGVEAG